MESQKNLDFSEIISLLKNDSMKSNQNSKEKILEKFYETLVLNDSYSTYLNSSKSEGVFFQLYGNFSDYLFYSGELEKFSNVFQIVCDYLVQKRDFKNILTYLEENKSRVSELKYRSYKIIGEIYQGKFQSVSISIDKLKDEIDPDLLKRILNFVSANINFEEAKRLENIDIINIYIEKKLNLIFDMFSWLELEKLKKNVLRLYVNKFIYEFEEEIVYADLLSFLIRLKDKNFALKVLNILKKKTLMEDIESLNSLEGRINDLPENNEKFEDLDTLEYFKLLQESQYEFVTKGVAEESIKRDFLMAKVFWREQSETWKLENFEHFIFELFNQKNFELGIFVCEEMEKVFSGKNRENRKKVVFLKAELLLESQLLPEAQEFIEKKIILFQTLRVETAFIIDLKYLLAESLYFQRKLERAKNEYLQVIAFDESYRLARERLNDIEQS